MLVRGQRIFHQGISGAVLDSAAGYATVELHDGRLLVVPEKDLQPAESRESAEARQR